MPVSVTPVSVTPVSVTPVSVTPVSVTPVSVTPVSNAPSGPALSPSGGGGLDLLPDEEEEEVHEEAEIEEEEEEEAPRSRRAPSGRNKAHRRTSSRRNRALAETDEFEDEEAFGGGARQPSGPDPKLLAGIGVAVVAVLVGGFLVLNSGSDDPPQVRVTRKSPKPSRSKATPKRSRPPKVKPKGATSGRAAYAALRRAWGRDGLKDLDALGATLTARGRGRLLELAYERYRVKDPAGHAKTCKTEGIDAEGLGDLEALGGELWSERYEVLARSVEDLQVKTLTGLKVRGKGGSGYLRLAVGRTSFDARFEFVQDESGWLLDFPDPIYPALRALEGLERALVLLKEGKAAEAFELLRDAPQTNAKASRARLDALKALAQGAVDEAAKSSLEDPLAAAERLQAFEAKYRDALAGTGLDESLRKVLVSLKGPEATADEPPERAAAAEKRAKEGLARVEALQARIRSEKGSLTKALSAELERARAESRKAPMNLKLTQGFSLGGAVLVDRNEQGFKVNATEGAAARSWSSVPDAIALKLRRLGVREDDAQDQLRFGYWALKQRLFKEADRAFERAIKLDGALSSKVPNVAELEEASRVFNGSYSQKGTSVTIEYPFRKQDEGKDWAFAPFRGTSAKVQDGALEATGRGIFVVGTQEIGFDGRCDLQATIEKVSGDHGGCFGIGFDTDGNDAVWYLVSVYPKHRFLRLYRYRNGNLETLKEKRKAVRPTGSTDIRVVIKGNSLKVSSRGQTRIAVNIPTPSWNGTRVFVGGAGPMKPATIRLSKVKLQGHVRFAWLRKSFARLDALLFKALSRAGELPVFGAGAADRPIDTALSAEDEFSLSKVSPQAVQAYRRAVSQIGSDDYRVLYKAADNIGNAIRVSPDFAAAYLLRARLFHKIGSAFLAERDLAIACRLAPRFYEAQAFRARVLLDIGRPKEALAQAEAAIKNAPGAAEGYIARGLVRFSQDQLEVALEDLELARALSPWEEELVGLTRNVQNVINGPPWARRFDAKTENYFVQTNVSATAAQAYAELLEAGRAHYAKTFPLPADGRRSKVLIFDTQEGYHGYSELSINDRVESTLGCYLPRYRQLLLFEEKGSKTQDKTIQVLLHEGFHQFMHQLVPDNAIPFWLNEGLAEFMSAVEVKGGRVGRTGLVLKGRLDNLRYFVKANGGRPMAFPKIMQETPQEFYSGTVWAKYAQAWSMVHFFELGATPDVKSRYKRYLKALREGTPSKEAYAESWSGVDWKAIQARWWAHVEGMK